jgi:hypothetical protein
MTQHISYKQTAVLCLAVGMLFGVAVSSAYFVSNPVVETEHEIQYKTVEKPVSDDGMVFAIYRGRNTPADFSFPVTVTFRRFSNDSWQPVHAAKADDGEPFVVDLNHSTQYQIFVTDAIGTERYLGRFKPTTDTREPVEIVIGR